MRMVSRLFIISLAAPALIAPSNPGCALTPAQSTTIAAREAKARSNSIAKAAEKARVEALAKGRAEADARARSEFEAKSRALAEAKFRAQAALVAARSKFDADKPTGGGATKLHGPTSSANTSQPSRKPHAVVSAHHGH